MPTGPLSDWRPVSHHDSRPARQPPVESRPEKVIVHVIPEDHDVTTFRTHTRLLDVPIDMGLAMRVLCVHKGGNTLFPAQPFQQCTVLWWSIGKTANVLCFLLGEYLCIVTAQSQFVHNAVVDVASTAITQHTGLTDPAACTGSSSLEARSLGTFALRPCVPQCD